MREIQAYVIEGDPVSGKNHMVVRRNRKTGKSFITKGEVAARWQLNAVGQLSQQRLRFRYKTMWDKVTVEYVAYQRADRCDIDNIETALFDALKKALVISDDRLIWDHRGKKAIDKENPRIEITITPIQEGSK